MIKKVFIINNKDKEYTQDFYDLLEHIKIQYKVELELRDYRDKIDSANDFETALLYLDDLSIKFFLQNHLNTGLKIGFLPNKECARALNSYGISKEIYEVIDEVMEQKNYTSVDVLKCNEEIVFTNVIVGDVHGMNYKQIEQGGIFSKIKSFYQNLKHLSFKDYALTTAKDQNIQTAATGIMVLEHNSKLARYNLINEDLSLHDGKLNAFILSPTSILSYLYYLFIITFYTKIFSSSLPKTLGFIKTSKLYIGSSKAIDFIIDGVLMSSKDISLEVSKEGLVLYLGKYVSQNTGTTGNNGAGEEEKDVMKIQNLPKGEVKNLLLTESIPLFKKANEDDFKELFVSIKENSQPSFVFIVLMVLSTLLATTGLFQNSTPVIIGAMILAPLMSPIISFSMGVVRAENTLIANSLKTLAFGILTALLFSCLYTYLMPLTIVTPEMRSRLNPNILDLMVAILSGIAGAYANAKNEIAKSLAGVAIAVALVPPLSVTGIGIGWGDFDMTYGSFLLFSTNLIGITLAAAVTFLVLGYSPIHRAKKGIIYTIFILALITVPLVASFDKVVKQNKIASELNHAVFTVEHKTIAIDVLHIDLSKTKTEIYLQTNSNDLLNKKDFTLLKDAVEKKLGQQVLLHISQNTLIN